MALEFPIDRTDLLLSPKDLDAPTLQMAADAGMLPSWSAARDFYESVGVKDVVR